MQEYLTGLKRDVVFEWRHAAKRCRKVRCGSGVLLGASPSSTTERVMAGCVPFEMLRGVCGVC
jgi:hypothetical protein